MDDRDYGLISRTIDEYVRLQYIIRAEDPRKEAEYQKRVLEVKLQAMGVVTEKLELD